MRPNKQPLNAPWTVDRWSSRLYEILVNTDYSSFVTAQCDSTLKWEFKMKSWHCGGGGAGEPDSVGALLSLSELIHPCGTSSTGKGHTSQWNRWSSCETASNRIFSEVWPLFILKLIIVLVMSLAFFFRRKSLVKSSTIKSLWLHFSVKTQTQTYGQYGVRGVYGESLAQLAGD